MGKTLNQEEIDALVRKSLHRAGGEELSTSESMRVEALSFQDAGAITSEQMDALSTLHGSFARSAAHNLSALLGATVALVLVSVEQMRYEELAQRIVAHSYASAIELLPMQAKAMVLLDGSLAATLIDLSLGGSGRPDAPSHEVTEIEDCILDGIVGLLCREMEKTWEQIALRFQKGARWPAAEARAAMPDAERTLALSFEISAGEGKGTLAFAIPGQVSQLLFRQWRQKSFRRARNEVSQQQLRVGLRRARVPVTLSLPSAKLPAVQLARLRPGDLLSLETPERALPELAVARQILWRAAAARSGQQKAAKLVETTSKDLEEQCPA